MNVLYFLVPLALILAAVGVAAFIWSVRSGQFDDVETPGVRVLFEDEKPAPANPDPEADLHVTSHDHGHQARPPQDGVDAEKGDQPT